MVISVLIELCKIINKKRVCVSQNISSSFFKTNMNNSRKSNRKSIQQIFGVLFAFAVFVCLCVLIGNIIFVN